MIPDKRPPHSDAIDIHFHPNKSASLFNVIAPKANPAKYKLPNKAIRKSDLHS